VRRVTPKKALGQHFLVDPNVLGVIDRLAGLDQGDVVLEVGPGLGVLTTFLADRVRHVHAVELDRSLDEPLRATLGERGNVTLVFGDALTLDIAALEPAPHKLVANLPYNVATPLVVETLVGVPVLESWCVMVQREVAERFFAEPGTKAYGAVSVIVRLHARRKGFHPVSRTVFRPQPNVDSALVAFERIAPPMDVGRLRRIVTGSFGSESTSTVSPMFKLKFAMKGNGCAGSTASGVNTRKIFFMKYWFSVFFSREVKEL